MGDATGPGLEPGTRGEFLQEVFRRLLACYGPQHWWPGDGPFEVAVGAILTQSAAWGNVEKAIANLKAAGAMDPAALHEMGEREIAELIRPSGYFNTKARKLKAFVEMLYAQAGGELERLLALPAGELRRLLLSTHGIGPETADSIVLYAAGKPSFVIDAYTRRIFQRIGLRPANDSYESWQRLFMDALPSDPDLFNEYHALIVAHGKALCRKVPRCRECVLLELCQFGKRAVG